MACRPAASPMPAAHRYQGEGGRAATEERGARWVNIVLSNVKRSIGSSYPPSVRPSTPAVTSVKRPTASIAAFACARCCCVCFTR